MVLESLVAGAVVLSHREKFRGVKIPAFLGRLLYEVGVGKDIDAEIELPLNHAKNSSTMAYLSPPNTEWRWHSWMRGRTAKHNLPTSAKCSRRGLRFITELVIRPPPASGLDRSHVQFGRGPCTRSEVRLLTRQQLKDIIIIKRFIHVDLEELYEFKIARRSWSVVPIHGEAPLRRKDYSGVLYRDNFYVFSGMRVPGYGLQNDIVKYNFSKRSSLICDQHKHRAVSQLAMDNCQLQDPLTLRWCMVGILRPIF
ncbi:Kelch-type beta propeller [Phytophthora cactorum]|nr:Kelch-type beta propeller [Phytophthora cactorum]